MGLAKKHGRMVDVAMTSMPSVAMTSSAVNDVILSNVGFDP